MFYTEGAFTNAIFEQDFREDNSVYTEGIFTNAKIKTRF